MATESSNGPARTAVRSAFVDRIPGSRIDGGPHRCRRPRHRAGRLFRDGLLGRRHARSSLGPRSESFSPVIGRRSGRRSGGQWIRSATRRPVTDLYVLDTTVKSAPTVVGTSSMGGAAALRPRNGKHSTVRPDRHARLRGVHAADDGAYDAQDIEGSRNHLRLRFLPNPDTSRLISAAPGTPNGWGSRGSRSRACQPGRIRAATECRQARLGRSDRPRLRSQSDRSRVRAAIVQHRPLPLMAPEGQAEGR